MRRKSVKNSLTVMCLAFVLVSAVVIGSIAIYNIGIMTSLANKNHQTDMKESYNTQIKIEVQSVISILQSEYDKSVKGELTEDEAKKEACEIVRNMRYRDEQDGYFWIDATDSTLIMHPILAEQEGMLWSSIFVTLQPNFCYGIIRHHNVPRKAFCNYCKNADVHDYNVHMQILPLQYTVLFLSDNNVDRLTHFLMY